MSIVREMFSRSLCTYFRKLFFVVVYFSLASIYLLKVKAVIQFNKNKSFQIIINN